MANLLNTSSDWLQDQQRQHASNEVTYTRGATSATVAATIGRTERDALDATGMVVVAESRDFLIHVAELAAFGEPRRGDRITEGGHVYDVQPISGGQDHWRYADGFRRRYRIHTKRLGAA